MSTGHSSAKYVVAIGLAIVVALISACGRTPEKATATTSSPDEESIPSIEGLDLPQTNPEIGVRLDSIPPGLVITLNTSIWIELTDLHNKSVQYSIVGVSPGMSGPAPSSPEEAEARIRESPDGDVRGAGNIKTAFGEAAWIEGTYIDDDGSVDDIYVFVPHPSGSGLMVLRSVCPHGELDSERRLAVIQELLTHVS